MSMAYVWWIQIPSTLSWLQVMPHMNILVVLVITTMPLNTTDDDAGEPYTLSQPCTNSCPLSHTGRIIWWAHSHNFESGRPLPQHPKQSSLFAAPDWDHHLWQTCTNVLSATKATLTTFLDTATDVCASNPTHLQVNTQAKRCNIMLSMKRMTTVLQRHWSPFRGRCLCTCTQHGIVEGMGCNCICQPPCSLCTMVPCHNILQQASFCSTCVKTHGLCTHQVVRSQVWGRKTSDGCSWNVGCVSQTHWTMFGRYATSKW